MTDSAAQQRVLTQVDAADLIDLASALIRIPSFKTEETPVARFLAPFFRERDYRVELQEVEPGRLQAIATLPGTGGGASLMLNGHTDINALTRRWKRDPWTPSLEGDRLYGHGVQNMKGGVASIIMAAEAVASAPGVPGATSVRVQHVMSRLTGGRDAATTRGARSCWRCSLHAVAVASGLLGFLGRPASESGRLRHADGAHGRGDRHRMVLKLPTLSRCRSTGGCR